MKDKEWIPDDVILLLAILIILSMVSTLQRLKPIDVEWDKSWIVGKGTR